MPGRPRKIPSYCRHKASGQAVVRIDGKDEYLGPYGTPASYEEYHRLLAERFPKGPTSAESPFGSSGACTIVGDLVVVELVAAYWMHAKAYYVKNGKPTSEQDSIRSALRPLNELYGHELCRHVGPLALEAVRNRMIEQGITRKRINQHIGRIRRMFRWAVAKELLPVAIYQSLTTLEGLRRGRSAAKESTPVRPVVTQHVEAVLPLLTPPIRAMVRLQSKIGCRPEEVTIVRPCDVDRTVDPWIYTPGSHKTEHHDLERKLPIGVEAQKILKPWLDRASDAYCFSPREGREAFDAERRRNRIGVPDEGYILHILDAHDADQFAIFLVAPEPNPTLDLMAKLVSGHVGIVPAVWRDDATVGFCCLVDDRVDRVDVIVVAGADHSLLLGFFLRDQSRIRGKARFIPRLAGNGRW